MPPRNLQDAIRSAVTMSAAIRAAIQGRQSEDDGWRGMLTGLMCDLALEHQYAIASLIHQAMPGSALALLRPLREATVRAYWLGLCAEEEQAVKISQEDSGFPDARTMHAEIERVLGSQKAAARLQVTAREREVLHGLTHSGIEQLKFRLSPGNLIKPSYPEGMLMQSLRDSTECALFISFILLRELGNPEPGLSIMTNRFNEMF